MHSFIPPLPGEASASAPDPTHTVAIKRWTREQLRLPDEVAVSVTETACVDPGCPLLETVVTVFDGPGKTRCWKFTRPRVAVTKLMVQQTLATPPLLGGT